MKKQDFFVLNLVFNLGDQKVSDNFNFRFGRIGMKIPYSLSVGFDRVIAEKKIQEQMKPHVPEGTK